MIEDPTNLTAVLIWLATAGAPYFVGQVLSLLAENWSAWHSLPRWLKFSAPLVLAPLVSIGATLLLRQTELIEQVSPWWSIIIGSITGYLGSQRAYMDVKRSGYGARYKTLK